MSMSLNRAQLIGHVTAAPELRYTPTGKSVCTFRVATNRVWTDHASGQRQESAEFTPCVAWQKLAEICSQLLTKGRQVYVDGRLQTREWETQERGKQRITEVVLENVIALGPAGKSGPAAGRRPDSVVSGQGDDQPTQTQPPADDQASDENPGEPAGKKSKSGKDEDVPPEDIPF